MQHIKNFKLVDVPHNADLLEMAPPGSLFLESEDGKDWYECQSLFSDRTIKIMYDNDGVIWGVVDKPVPQRDNTYAVSMLWPIDMSVVEISHENYPKECRADGTWKYDEGKVTKIPADYVALAEVEKVKRLSEAAVAMAPLQDAVDLDIATDDEITLLAALKKYRVLLNRVDTSMAPDIEWPEMPERNASTDR